MAREKAPSKTNAVRVVDLRKIKYQLHEYDASDGKIDGVSVAIKAGVAVEKVFKTLVTVGASKEHYVFVIPVAEELDLKKAAKHFGEKKIEMIHSKELLPLTGYVHGGCSPIGIKKQFKTALDETAAEHSTIYVSAGRIGTQIEIASS
ncbi:MAG: Cys-tRNA(Pro) deacylase, partial [Eubacteriales bacterium]|nr:Cys-tRNA(Pro) deacylase [Eubacteriales bacterium]